MIRETGMERCRHGARELLERDDALGLTQQAEPQAQVHGAVRGSTPYREGQERDLKVCLSGTDPSIPLVFVSGNHDLGNAPTPETVAHPGDCSPPRRLSATPGKTTTLVLNFQLLCDASACPDLRDAQEAWLEGQLQRASQGQTATRQSLIGRFTTAWTWCLGDDTHGVRVVVVVTTDQVIHLYHGLEQLSGRGMDEDLRKLLQA
ncbi:unnamed protein product [Coregonus sp. 'balchen']|nr:unnamed protein product [Coregonus sp. 'balchen']